MELKYDNDAVKKYFTNYELMQKKIGKDMTRAVKKRVGELSAANNFSIFLSLGLGKPHMLSHDLKGCCAVNVTGNFRLVLKPLAASLEPKDLNQCVAIIVKGVDDYHGGKNKWIIP